MRKKERIPEVLSKLQAVWEKYPDLRLGQLILNLEYMNPAIYHIEDDELVEMLEDFYCKEKAD